MIESLKKTAQSAVAALQQAGADFIVESPRDILAVL